MKEVKRDWSRPSERAVKVSFSVCASMCLGITGRQAVLSTLQGQNKR